MTITFKTLPTNPKASNIFIEIERARQGIAQTAILNQKLSLIGQYDPAKTGVIDYVPRQVSSAGEVATIYGFGSMLHLMAIKAFATISTSGIPVFIHPVPEVLAGVAAEFVITPVGTATSSGTLFIYISNQLIEVSVTLDDDSNTIAASINTAIAAKLNVPVTTSVILDDVTLTSKWKGETSNKINVSFNLNDGDLEKNPAGVVIGVGTGAGGTTSPDTTNVFTNMGSTFFTKLAFAFDDSSNLTILDAAGDTRHDSSFRRIIVPIIGRTDGDSTFESFVQPLDSEWINAVPVFNSVALPFEVAARVAAMTAIRSQGDPAQSYRNMSLGDIRAGSKTELLDYARQNEIEIAGGSVTFVDDTGTVRILDLNTTQKTDEFAQPIPNFQARTVLWSNNQAKSFSLENLLTNPPFDAAKIVDNDAITSQPFAISPDKLKSFIISLIDQVWIPLAWTKNRDEVVASIVTEIDALNAEQLNVTINDDHAVGLRIMGVLYRYTATSSA